MKKNKGKKGDDESIEEQLNTLKLDIDILEHDIHLEEMREVKAKKDYDDLILKTGEVQSDIDKLKKSKDLEIKTKSEALAESEDKKANEIQQKKALIESLETQIVNLQREIEQNRKDYEIKEAEKDEEIKAQENLFQQMTTKFQHILENTASKLQERVKMGN